MKDSKGGILKSSKIEDILSAINPAVPEGGAMLEFTPWFLVEKSLLDEGNEDGLTLSRRSVLTEKLPPARHTPPTRASKQRERTPHGPRGTLPV